MRNPHGLLHFDWDAPVPDEDRDQLFAQIAETVHKWRMEVPAVLFLEASAPLSHLAGQGLVAFSPFIAPWLPDGIHGVQRLQKILEQPQNVRLLIDRIAEAAGEEPDKKDLDQKEP